MVVIKIFMPNEKNGKYLYGHKIMEQKGQKILVSYIVITTSKKIITDTKLENLGTISQFRLENNEMNIVMNDQDNLIEVTINGKELPKEHRILLLRYDKEKFLKCFDETDNQCSPDMDFPLLIAKSLKDEHEKNCRKDFTTQLLVKFHNGLISFSTFASKTLRFLSPVFLNTVTYRHCSNWKKCLNNGNSRNGFVILDVFLGIMFFALMNHIQHSGYYFMASAEIVVNKLRNLLEVFDGSPAGLKLNVQLNNFLLSCFMYHVDLWWNFIVLIEPAIHYLFFPIAIFGLMGFSFQCAMICDLITMITLHAHCFYIYAAMLYRLELSSIKALSRIVLGRRLNVLKSKQVNNIMN